MSRKGTPRSRRWRGKSFAAEILRLTKLVQREIVRIGLSRRRAASSTSYQGGPWVPSQRVSSSGISIRRRAGVRDKGRAILYTLKGEFLWPQIVPSKPRGKSSAYYLELCSRWSWRTNIRSSLTSRGK